ncbi:hypothetical protein [Ramlibacter sp.]|uniref:hypothetical protein n=1 Tax=Ramlibacter sp. TaxID=1917967 RepID=UPI003D0AE749
MSSNPLDPHRSPQPELDLDHADALEQEMRSLFESQWSRWHPKPYEEAMQDPLTRRLLCLAVQHMPPPRASGPRFLNVPKRARR